MSSVLINEGSVTAIATDTVGTVKYQIIKLDMGTAGTNSLFSGTIPVVSAVGSVSGTVTTLESSVGPGGNVPTDVWGNIMKPVNDSTYAPTEYTSFGAVAGTNVKSSAGNIYSVYVDHIGSAVRYFQIFNASTAVPNGATPVASYRMGSVATGNIGVLPLDTTHFSPSRYMGTGISWAISSTNGTLGTASVTASEYNVHIKYM
jgi:hypothetical protein